eukprot:6188009-Pleurochrysis_carterae.AAC.1
MHMLSRWRPRHRAQRREPHQPCPERVKGGAGKGGWPRDATTAADAARSTCCPVGSDTCIPRSAYTMGYRKLLLADAVLRSAMAEAMSSNSGARVWTAPKTTVTEFGAFQKPRSA